MSDTSHILQSALTALQYEGHVNLHRSPIALDFVRGDLLLEGEVAHIAEKRRAVECVRGVDGVEQVVDRLCVQPIDRLGDGTIRDTLFRNLQGERIFLRTALNGRLEHDAEAVEVRPDHADGRIDVSVAGGVVTLRGQVLSLSHRRLAGVLAWWTPGCRNVINGLTVEPFEQDNDGEISDAIDLVLKKNPTIHSDQITRRVRDRSVRLHGVLTTNEERRAVERDVWYVEGVRDVHNAIDLYSAPTRS
jgi:osmotically-inducible protein OsmY